MRSRHQEFRELNMGTSGTFLGRSWSSMDFFCKSTFHEIRMKEFMLYLGNTFAITMA